MSGPRNSRRKTLQLARQVQRALTFAVTETGDDRLLSAWVQDVEPHPDAGQMMVSVITGQSPEDTLAALHEHAGRLRTEVAHAITRRRAPELHFRVEKQPGPSP